LNRRPPAPKAGALPGCATPRHACNDSKAVPGLLLPESACSFLISAGFLYHIHIPVADARKKVLAGKIGK
jgi:hypothetical protein